MNAAYVKAALEILDQYSMGQYMNPYSMGQYSRTGDSGKDHCTAGYAIISEESECRAAAVKLGKAWKGEFSAEDYPAGCSDRIHHHSYTGVWFNPTLTATYDGHSFSGAAATICKAARFLADLIENRLV
jgi:hypothetical protein